MKQTYYAIIKYNKKDNVYEGSFTEYPAIQVQGKTISETENAAKDALEAYASITKKLVEPSKCIKIKEKVILRKITMEF